MNPRRAKTGEPLKAVIKLVEGEDWEIIENQESLEFVWKREKGHMVHQIRLIMEEEVLGLISLEDIPNELRVHVRLIEVNQQDRGKERRYEGIAGCLLAFSCQTSFQKGYEGFVSLHPKTALIDHYKQAYGFEQMGNHLYVDLEAAQQLVDRYLTQT